MLETALKQSAWFSVLLVFVHVLAANVAAAPAAEPGTLDLPWRAAGLDERQAAAHLLNRLTFGPRPGDVDRLVGVGLSDWLAAQLERTVDDPRLVAHLDDFESLDLSTREIVRRYPNPGRVLREARHEGVIGAVAVSRRGRGEEGSGEHPDRETMRELFAFARERGYRPQRELLGELMVQKLDRALLAEHQLAEVLTDFFFNHFNVTITKGEARVFVPTYERDAIRPHVLGSFRDMLEATAKHPAMLLYLDNARSVAGEGVPTTFDLEEMRRRFEERRPLGLNENYARELLELHTLGVDGGYTQEDVVEVARAFTGWTTYPPGRGREDIERRVSKVRTRMARAGFRENPGFVLEEDFFFRADVHDAAAKTVLGRRLPAGRGIEDGLEVLDLLAVHPSTARHLATKLAVRFVADEPPPALVDRLAETWLASGGDLRRVMTTLVESPEFWAPAARRQKIKSPFELAVSALRALDAEVPHPLRLLEWVSRMGQPLYAYDAPTGYPDRANAWVNTGALLHRMNFGLELATGRIPGVELDLLALNGHREPESLEAALETYTALLLPERDPAPTVERLLSVVRDPELIRKIGAAAPAGDSPKLELGDWDDFDFRPGAVRPGIVRRGPERLKPTEPGEIDTSPLAHVVGVILGSPEFQRR